MGSSRLQVAERVGKSDLSIIPRIVGIRAILTVRILPRTVPASGVSSHF
jgi:hypothetical protein